MKKLVLTGAAGRLGSYLREPLSQMCEELISTDLSDNIGSTYNGERYVKADLANFDEVNKIMDGAEMIIHFGALSDEDSFEIRTSLALTMCGRQLPAIRLIELFMLAPFML